MSHSRAFALTANTQTTVPDANFLKQARVYKIGGVLLLAFQCLVGYFYVFKVPLWMPSDERAHMRYVIDLAHSGTLHVMEVGDASYETHQPPRFCGMAAAAINSAPALTVEQQR
jgi:hypothetical protein